MPGPYARAQVEIRELMGAPPERNDWFGTDEERLGEKLTIASLLEVGCYRDSTELEIVDEVYENYRSMAAGIDALVEQLEEGAFTECFGNLNRTRNQGRKLAKWQILDRKLQPYCADYPVVSWLACERLFIWGVDKRDFSLCLGMITQLQDPILAKSFLQRISQAKPDPAKPLKLDMGSENWGEESRSSDGDDWDRVTDIADTSRRPPKVYAALRQHIVTASRMSLRLPSTRALAAFRAGRVLAGPEGLLGNLEIGRTIARPLGKIAMMPPVSVRLLYAARDGKSLVK